MIIFLNEVCELFWFLGCVGAVVKECGGGALVSVMLIVVFVECIVVQCGVLLKP